MSVAQRLYELSAAKSADKPAAGNWKFKVGDQVQRDPRIWKKEHPYNYGTIMAQKMGKDNKGKQVRGYQVLPDPDKKGEMNFFTNKMEPSPGVWYSETELVPYAGKRSSKK